jgi:serine/threonine protein kinase
VGNTPVAVKQLQVGVLTETTKTDLKKEAYIHSQAHNHPNVCKLYGIVLEDAANCMLVMERCQGDLMQVLMDDSRVLTWKIKLKMA